MKIAFLDPTAQAGGAERILLESLAGLRVARPDWSFHVTFGADGPMVSETRLLGATAAVLPFPDALAKLGEGARNGTKGSAGARVDLIARMLRAVPETAGYLFELRRTLKQVAPNLIHANGLKMDLLGLWAKPSPAALLWHVHDHLAARPIMPHLMRLGAGSCSGAIANSKSVARELRSVCGRDLKIFTVYNAVDLNRFTPDGSRLDLDALSGLPAAPSGTVRVGLVATMARWKGHEVFLRALSMLPTGTAVRGYVIGGPIYQTDHSQRSIEELRSIADGLGIAARVGFTGFVNDAASAMRSLDIVVHASTEPEPFGLVIAEAMACGRAIVISEAGGAAEIVSIGTDALSHPPGDAVSLADRIAKLAGNPTLRENLGTAARSAAERRFDRERMADELAAIYEALTQSSN